MNAIWVHATDLKMNNYIPESFITTMKYVLIEHIPLELMFLGTENGHVLIANLTEDQQKPSVQKIEVAQSEQICRATSPSVTCLDVIGAILVFGTSDGWIDLWNFQEMKRVLKPSTVLRHNTQSSGISAALEPGCILELRTWEGPSSLIADPEEEVALYILSCAADFCVKIWRVDVMREDYSVWAVCGSTASLVRCFTLVTLPQEHIIAGVGKYLHYWTLQGRDVSSTTDWIGRQVYMREEHKVLHVLQEAQSVNEPFRLKNKHREATDARIFGTVTNHIDGSMNSVGNVVDVDFPHLKNSCRWPTRAFGFVTTPRRMWKGSTEGDGNAHISTVQVVQQNKELWPLVASGDERGTIKTWRYDDERDLYAPMYTISGAHSDLVRRILPLSGSTFLTCGYDGCAKHWWFGSLSEETSSPIAISLIHKVPCYSNFSGTSDLNGIMCAEVFKPGLCLLTVQRFQCTISCRYFRTVAGCTLPPEWIYDGEKSVIAARKN